MKLRFFQCYTYYTDSSVSSVTDGPEKTVQANASRSRSIAFEDQLIVNTEQGSRLINCISTTFKMRHELFKILMKRTY